MGLQRSRARRRHRSHDAVPPRPLCVGRQDSLPSNRRARRDNPEQPRAQHLHAAAHGGAQRQRHSRLHRERAEAPQGGLEVLD
jgi:hypothetical protein